MRKITGKRLQDHVGKVVAIEREGIQGNLFSELEDGTVVAKEGELLGILYKDNSGFYVRMFRTRWDDGYGTRIDKTNFFENVYRLQDRDVIRLYSGSRIVRFS